MYLVIGRDKSLLLKSQSHSNDTYKQEEIIQIPELWVCNLKDNLLSNEYILFLYWICFYTLIRQYSLMDFSRIKIEANTFNSRYRYIHDDLSLNNSVIIYISSTHISLIYKIVPTFQNMFLSLASAIEED